MKQFEPGTEVMLKPEGREPDDRFNPHYLLVERDLGLSFQQDDWSVYCLCEDGKTRRFQRKFLMAWSEVAV